MFSFYKIKQTFLSLCFLFTGLAVFAQSGRISGKVVFANGKPAAGVSVTVSSISQIGITNETGLYTIPAVPFGTYEVTFTSLEAETLKMKVGVKGAETKLNVSLTPQEGKRLDEVQVMGKTVKKTLETSGFAVAVIETKEASLRNLTTNELLDRAVGVRVRQNGGIGSQVEYNLNGMSGSAIGIFLDGTPISTFGQSFNLNNIPPAMIERIEVYKGVLPSHLAGDYVGGAINVIMKKDASANNVTAAVSYGSFNTFQTDISALYRHQGSGFTTRASGFYTYTDNSYETWGKFSTITEPDLKLKRFQRIKRFNDTYKSVGGRVEAGFTDVKWADQFFLGLNLSDTYDEIPHGITMAQPYVGRIQEFNAKVFSLNYIKNDLLLQGLSLNINAVHSNRGTYLRDTSRAIYNWDGKPLLVMRGGVPTPLVRPVGQGQQGTAVITNIDRAITNIRTNLSYMVAQGHRISFNYNLNATQREDQDLLNLNNITNTGNERSTSTHILAFNYEAQTFNDKLKTNLLAKYTINQNHIQLPYTQTVNGVPRNFTKDTTISNKNPGFGFTVSYNIIPKLFIIASNENTYISPREEQIYGSPEINILENLALKPERNINYNLGFRYSPLQIGKHKLSFYASAFWRNGYDKIAMQAVDSVIVGRESDANIETTKYINLGRTQARGVEGEIIYVYDNKINALFNFSKFNSLFKQEFDENGNKHAFYDRQVPNEPFFTMNGSVQYRINNLIQKSSIVNLYYNTGYVAPFKTVWYDSEGWFTTIAQFYHDIGGSYRTPNGKLVMSLDFKNIFNAEVYDNFGVQKPGRGIYVKFNYMLNHFNKK